MIQPRGRSSFLVEPRNDFGIGGLIGGQELERNLTIELGVPSAIDRAHASHADDVFDHEAVEHVAGNRQGWGRLEGRGRRRRSLSCGAAPSAVHGRRPVGK